MIRFALPLVVMLAAAVPAGAQPQPVPPADPVVVSSGEGLVTRAPDRAFFVATVESRAKNPKEAQKLNADAMAAVLQRLRGAGLRGDALQTRAYELQPDYDYNNGRQTVRGYVARNSVEVRADDLGKVGELLDLAVTAGATSVGVVRFDLADRAGAERDALRLAVEDARKRADAAVSGAGLKVDRVIRIEEHRARVAPPMPFAMAERMTVADARGAAPPVEPAELEIRATVTLTATIR